MAENETSIVDWLTTALNNSPADADDVNSTATDKYAGIANYFRDVKAAVRSESLNLGFDPSTVYINDEVGAKFLKNGDDTRSFLVKGVNLGADRGIVEGQAFFVESYSSTSYAYYSGYVLALEYSSSNTIVYASGLTRWEETTSSQDGSGLTALAPRDDFLPDDLEDFEHVKSSVSFSSYVPTQNLGWALANAADASNAADSYMGSLPWNRQFGSFYVPPDEKEIAVVLPHQEPDVYYTVSLTPTKVDGTGLSYQAFSVNTMTKARSFFVVEFISKPNEAGLSDPPQAIYWDWEIHRDY